MQDISQQSTPLVILVTNIPTPYRNPLYEEVSRQLADEGYRLLVVFGSSVEKGREWEIDLDACEFEYRFLPSRTVKALSSDTPALNYPGLISLVRELRPAVIVTNGFSLATIKLWLYSFINRLPYIIWSGAIVPDTRKAGWLIEFYRRILTRGASGYIAYGKMAKKYLVSLGASESRVHISTNTVDTEFFTSEVDRIRAATPEPGDRKRLLYIGYLREKKCVDLLLDMVAVLARKRQDFVLDIVGDGDERQKLEEKAKQLGITGLVNFAGYQQKQAIPEYLAGAECLLFPTAADVWGLVLVEAMSAGVPCISSVHAGAAHDIIEEGVTGFIVDFGDIEQPASRVEWLLDNPEDAKHMGTRCREFSNTNLSISASASGFLRGIISTHRKSINNY